MFDARMTDYQEQDRHPGAEEQHREDGVHDLGVARGDIELRRLKGRIQLLRAQAVTRRLMINMIRNRPYSLWYLRAF